MLAYRIFPGAVSLKILFLLFDLGVILLLILIMNMLKRNPLGVVIYAWNPLAVIEISGSGHLDTIAIFWIVLAVYFYYKKSPAFILFSLMLAFLSKFLAAPLLLLCAKSMRGKNILITIGLAALFFVPFTITGGNILKGTIHYLVLWEFNGSIFPVLLYLTKSYTLAKTFISAILAIIIIYVIIKKIEFPRAVFVILCAMLILSPSVHPWYLLWILPFLCIYEKASWLVLTGTIVFSYSVLTGYYFLGEWRESVIGRLFVYAPFCLVFIFEIAEGFIYRKKSRHA